MKSLTSLSNILLAAFVLLGPVPAASQFVFAKTGTILSLNNDSINIDDAQYRLSPTVKIAIPSTNPDNPGYMKGELKQLEAGNLVQITVININKRRYVDTIFLLDKTSPDKREQGLK